MEPGIYHQTISHDAGCPTLFSRRMQDCKCKPEIKIEKSTSMKFTEKKIKQDLIGWLREKAKFN